MPIERISSFRESKNTYLKILLIITLCFSSNIYAQDFPCDKIDRERKVFLQTYQKNKYQQAYLRLSEWVHRYPPSENCWNTHINSQLWAFSDLTRAAIELKNPKLCFENIYKVNDLVAVHGDYRKHPLKGKYKVPLKALMGNYEKCLELKNGITEASKLKCIGKPAMFCGNFKVLMMLKGLFNAN